MATEAALAVFKDTLADKIYGAEVYKKAFAAGLPEDDEILARRECAGLYLDILNLKGKPEQAALSEFENILGHMERSIAIDREGDYQYYSTRLGRALIALYDRVVSVAGRRIKELQGGTAAIAYLEAKIQVTSYLRSTPMLSSLLELGVSYPEADEESALKCFRAIVEAEPVMTDTTDTTEQKIRRLARDNIRIAEERTQPQSRLQQEQLTAREDASGLRTAEQRLRRAKIVFLLALLFGALWGVAIAPPAERFGSSIFLALFCSYLFPSWYLTILTVWKRYPGWCERRIRRWFGLPEWRFPGWNIDRRFLQTFFVSYPLLAISLCLILQISYIYAIVGGGVREYRRYKRIATAKA